VSISDWRASSQGLTALQNFATTTFRDRFGSSATLSRVGPFLLIPRERRDSRHPGIHTPCHKETYAVQQRNRLFDHLVGAQQERIRDCQAKYLCGGQVQDEIELGRLFDRQVGRLRSP